MPQGKKGIADSGYKHLNEHIAIHREGHSKEMTNHINCVRARHENIYSRLKVFDILSDSSRGSWEKHDEHKNVFRRMLSSCPVRHGKRPSPYGNMKSILQSFTL